MKRFLRWLATPFLYAWWKYRKRCVRCGAERIVTLHGLLITHYLCDKDLRRRMVAFQNRHQEAARVEGRLPWYNLHEALTKRKDK